jgi:hypothetical protein
MMAGEGTSKRSETRMDPPLHILAFIGSERVLWCSGGPANKENTVTRRPCPKCMALVLEMFDNLEDES